MRVDAWRDDAARALVIADAPDATFAVTYVHSVTRTPVVERYRVEGDAIVQTEIDFVQHGPGLPTEPDAGGTFAQRDGDDGDDAGAPLPGDRDARASRPVAAAR